MSFTNSLVWSRREIVNKPWIGRNDNRSHQEDSVKNENNSKSSK